MWFIFVEGSKVDSSHLLRYDFYCFTHDFINPSPSTSVFCFNPSPSTSVVNVLTPSSQAIPASPTASVFGYTLSGGIDVDNNGYPGITFLTLLKFGNSTRIH